MSIQKTGSSGYVRRALFLCARCAARGKSPHQGLQCAARLSGARLCPARTSHKTPRSSGAERVNAGEHAYIYIGTQVVRSSPHEQDGAHSQNAFWGQIVSARLGRSMLLGPTMPRSLVCSTCGQVCCSPSWFGRRRPSWGGKLPKGQG